MVHDRMTGEDHRAGPRGVRLFTLLAVLLPLAGCGSLPDVPTPKIPGVYRLNIQQGNLITQEMLDRLEIGMEKRKVRFVLGTPLLVDPFNENRWEYLYSYRPGGGDVTRRRVSVLFEDDRLASVTGDLESVANISTAEAEEKLVTVPQIREKTGLLGALTPDIFQEQRAPSRSPASPEEPTPDQPAEAGATSETEPAEENESAFEKFLRTLTEPAEQTEEEAEPSVAAATAPPSVQIPPGASSEEAARADDDFLRDLFEGLGSAASPAADSRRPPPASGPRTRTTATTEATPPNEEETGFLQGLMERIRTNVETDGSGEGAPVPASTGGETESR